MNRTLFELSRDGVSGATVVDADFPSDFVRTSAIGLPELTEVEVVRHYTKLSRDSHGVDNGTYPLGSCTMKYNPKRNDAMAELEGFVHAHPAQPPETLAGVWELLYRFGECLAELTGMDITTTQPAAGAHGELTGLLMMRRYFEDRGEARSVLLIQDSAHGTNPASASMAGFSCQIIPTTRDGLIDMEKLRLAIGPDVAGIMLTNPSTLGLFEENIIEVAELLHANGSLLYYDGANMNALMGIVRPGDMGFDIAHINTHKTLSTPHGGGGPGAGPVCAKAFLEPYLPTPVIVNRGETYSADYDRPKSIGRMKSYFGHVGVLIRAYSYLLTCGPKALRVASENAVLNANYMQARLSSYLPAVFEKRCMHECLVSCGKLEVNSFDFSKRLIDYGVHPPTIVGAGCVYFSSGLKAAMLIEPTETETQETLDEMVEVFLKVIQESSRTPEIVQSAPHSKGVGKIQTQLHGDEPCAPSPE